jgi:hypothetical protein
VAVEAAVDAGLGLVVGRTAGCGWGAAKAPLLLLLLPPPAEPAVRAWLLLLLPPPAEPAVRAWPLLLLPLAEWGMA